MPSRQPLTTRALLASVALAATITLAACDPDDVSGADASPATTTAAASAAATTSAPKASSASTAPAAGGKRTLVEARTAGGLTKATGNGELTDVPVDPGEMRDGMHLVAANYNRAGQTSGRRILFIGVDNVPEEPSKRREHLWRGLIDYALGNGSTGSPTTAKPYPAGPLGGDLECLSLPESANATDVLCGWVDSSAAAVALFPRTTPADAARLFAAMRADLEH
ncbi:hypothetical protein GCM10010193_37460 [Kitasatospora atroaurantiaca]|uniref:Lipoprotein n=1 Tax=Kitasatospora atroaurantiaca TaxID=285545 RepID=A0A561F208_9ACTN|nr:hypothetical protein [Kitasatospora atroaurantiaca]TWE21891.1 hypothetical protein FB465_7135 [Kitasatospora atroaurantiaca]